MAYIRNFTSRHNWLFTGKRYDNLQTVSSPGHIATTATRSGEAVPKFRSVIQSGGNATSNYSLSSVLKVEAEGRFNLQCTTIAKDPPKNTRLVESCSGTYLGLPILGSQNVAATANLALTRLYKRLSEQQTQMNGLQFLGELRESIRMLRSPFRSARALVDKYTLNLQTKARRYRPRESRLGKISFEKAIADSWLEVSFGLTPLISDARAIAEVAARLVTGDYRRRDRVVSYAEVPVSAVENAFTMGTGVSPALLSLRVKELNTVVHSVRFIAALDWNRTAAVSSLGRVGDLAGFRLDLFIPTLYELTPYSWLVDYFTNLGDVIETGCQATSFVSRVIRTDQVNSILVGSVSGFHNDASFTGWVTGTPGSYRVIRKSFVRTNVGSSVPNVQFEVRLPGGPAKVANMLALWSSRLRKI